MPTYRPCLKPDQSYRRSISPRSVSVLSFSLRLGLQTGVFLHRNFAFISHLLHVHYLSLLFMLWFSERIACFEGGLSLQTSDLIKAEE